jgi:hypothetical protein
VPFSTPLEHTEDAIGGKATNGLAGRGSGKAGAVGEPRDGKMETAFALQMTVTKKMNVNSAIGGGEFEMRNKKVGELFPDEFGVGFLGFHF